jgi:serine/threonine protein kinase
VRLPDRAAWHIVERVLTALAYAHNFCDDGNQATPIVHRDVSPSNILLDWSGGVKIADFGIAKVLGVSPGTRLGIVKGTLGCMAPEQARGDAVDERADVYAAALLAWRIATGRVPFGKHQKDEYELLRAMRNPRIKPLSVLRPDLPEALLDGVARALEPERDQRTITAAELADIVRASIDVGAGWLELANLLDTWKRALERTVRRVPGLESGDSSGGRVAQTLRYEEVALAFDDDAPADGPTFEAHALPSDPHVLAAMPIAEEEPVASTTPASWPPPPAPVSPFESASGRTPQPASPSVSGDVSGAASVPSAVSPNTTGEEPAPAPRLPVRKRRTWAPALAVAAFVAVGLAALLARFAR